MRLIRVLRDCKQRSLTVSKHAPTVSKKLPPLLGFEYQAATKSTLCPCPLLEEERMVLRALEPRRIKTSWREISLGWMWADIRPMLLHDLKRTEFALLERRRASLYQGIDVLDWKAHRKLLKSLNSYHAMTLLRVWTGCPMAGSHKKTLGLIQDPSCTCGTVGERLRGNAIRGNRPERF